MRGRSVTQLDKASFRRSLAVTGATPASSVVLFCKKGDEHCETLMPSFENLFLRMLQRRDRGGEVRFATMDCSDSTAGEGSLEFCQQLGVDTFPMVVHYRGQERVGHWTSGNGGLIPWLLRQMSDAETAPKNDADLGLQDSSSGTALKPSKNSEEEEIWLPGLGELRDIAANMFCLGQDVESGTYSSRQCIESVSHLSDLHEMILLEDCLLSRVLSLVLLLAILGKTAFVIVTDAELWPFAGSPSSGTFDAPHHATAFMGDGSRRATTSGMNSAISSASPGADGPVKPSSAHRHQPVVGSINPLASSGPAPASAVVASPPTGGDGDRPLGNSYLF